MAAGERTVPLLDPSERPSQEIADSMAAYVVIGQMKRGEITGFETQLRDFVAATRELPLNNVVLVRKAMGLQAVFGQKTALVIDTWIEAGLNAQRRSANESPLQEFYNHASG